jgi:uncharacterized lipoprotein YbaY
MSFLRVLCFPGIAAAALLLAGCAKDEPKAGSEPVSTIPWNRPEKWEGQGMLGGFQGSQ